MIDIHVKKVMLDRGLAELYGVETAHLKRAVRRNIERFPHDFMFELSKSELKNLRCQVGTSRWGGQRYLPMAFTDRDSMLKRKARKKILIQMERWSELPAIPHTDTTAGFDTLADN